ncbi:jg18221 [Pararge aegeria aegeria]|uniref:Jg18221 protein n=1 Tax=Pararge aegeria aegeria TaxID=348720 RepID=A0A8S4RBW6_9NEOP|nr:jg18221 [Pararge aegeria aegeria]
MWLPGEKDAGEHQQNSEDDCWQVGQQFCITFYVIAVTVATPADPSRPRRDLTRIQNIIKWLLGINERKLIPLIGNENQRVYTIPADEKFLLRAPAQMEVDGNIRQVLAGGPYPERLYPSVQTIPNPFVYNNYPSAVQEYAQIRDGDYVYRKPMYLSNRLPTYQESIRPLCPISITNVEACGYDTRGIITETSQRLPQPPMHIRNRMREIIVNHPVSPLNVQQDIAMPPPELRKVNVFDYSRNHDETEINDATLIKTEGQVEPILSIKLNSEADTNAQGLVTNTDIITKNKVTFAAPVHSKYRYKMIYHNQPERNTVVEMDSMGSPTAKPNEEASTPSVKESTDVMKNPANYIYMPPVNTEIPPPGLPSDITAQKKPEETDNYTAVASENKPIVDESSFTNTASREKPSRVIIRRRKLKSRPENGRGDIPDISLQ